MRVMTISSNSLNNASLCMRKYDFERQRSLEPLEKAEPLEKGDIVHYLLAKYYRGKMAGVKTADMLPEIIASGRRYVLTMDLPVEVAEESIKQFRHYVIYYANDTWVPVAVEQPFSRLLYERPDVPCSEHVIATDGAIKLGWRKDCPKCKVGEGLKILFEGKIDLIVRVMSQGGLLLIVDHKTGSRYTEVSPLSNQFSGYAWSFRDLLPNQNIRAVRNFIGFQKTLPVHERMRRSVVNYTPVRLEEWREQAIYWCHHIVGCIDANYFPPNYTSCDKYSGCIFREICDADPSARDRKLKQRFKIRAPHNIFEEEADVEISHA